MLCGARSTLVFSTEALRGRRKAHKRLSRFMEAYVPENPVAAQTDEWLKKIRA
jgi:hypothetical protein